MRGGINMKHDQQLMPWATISSVAAEMGRMGGRSRSKKKVESARVNVKKALEAELERRRRIREEGEKA
jgi:hypothetical protein